MPPAALFVLVGIVLSPLRATATTIPMLVAFGGTVAYDANRVGDLGTTGGGSVAECE